MGLKTYKKRQVPGSHAQLHAAGLLPLPTAEQKARGGFSGESEAQSAGMFPSGLRGTYLQRKVGAPRCKQGSLASFGKRNAEIPWEPGSQNNHSPVAAHQARSPKSPGNELSYVNIHTFISGTGLTARSPESTERHRKSPLVL